MAIALLVDDSQTIRRIVEMAFKGSGHDVVTATSGSEARQALARYSPSLVMVNYMLPDGSGVALCQAIRSDPMTASLPVLVLGGTYAAFDANEARAAGAQGVVMKPFKTDDLLQPALRLIQEGGASATSPVPPMMEVSDRTMPIRPVEHLQPLAHAPSAPSMAQTARPELRHGPVETRQASDMPHPMGGPTHGPAVPVSGLREPAHVPRVPLSRPEAPAPVPGPPGSRVNCARPVVFNRRGGLCRHPPTGVLL
jgi:CheY-like chemotaxis protein